MNARFGRILTAMVTPMHDDYSVNYAQAAKLAEYLVENGSDGVVVAGSTGEAATLQADEKLKLYAAVLDAVGDKAHVIAGTGSNDTRASVKMTQEAEKIGVHGAMLVGPYYNKPTQEGYYRHFKAIAEATALPLIIYNVPGRTGSNILPVTIKKLSSINNVVAIKEASGNLEQVSEIVRITSPDFSVYSGDDGLTLPMLSIGACGVISVAAHIVGNKMKKMVESFIAGDIALARTIHLELMPAFKGMFITTNPIPVKTAVNLLGLQAGPLRLPLTEATDEETQRLKELLHSFK